MKPKDAARFTTPMSPDSSRHEEHHPFELEPLGPISIFSLSPVQSLYQFAWAADPYEPTECLTSHEVAIRNHLFAVEFRITSVDVSKPEVRFYARVHPDYNKAFHLACERVTANEWERVALFIPHEGGYGIDVQVRPDRPGFHTRLVKHRYLTIVYNERDKMRAPLGALEQKILFRGEQSERKNLEIATESYYHSVPDGVQPHAYADARKTDDFFAQWLRFSP